MERARAGDSSALNELFNGIRPQLASFVYRIIADRDESDDIVQETFLKCLEHFSRFRGESSFKTWAFAIASNHAKRVARDRSRWSQDTMERIREHAHQNPELMRTLENTNLTAPNGRFDVAEHVDFCFSCTGKMLSIDHQMALLLKDIYQFRIRDIARVLEFSESKVKRLLVEARRDMIDVFETTCALVNKRGVCAQCSELNGKFNPKQNEREAVMKLKFARLAHRRSKQRLYKMRARLCSTIEPLANGGTDLHEVFFELCHRVN